MEDLMRKMLVVVATIVLFAAGLGLWLKSSGPATSAPTPKTISTHELHLGTDVTKLPVTTIEEIN
jgi:hypothetical protein